MYAIKYIFTIQLKQTTPRAELLIEKERMTIGDDVIGTGNFGEVRKATLRMTLDTNLDVVIKIITGTDKMVIVVYHHT